MWYNFYHSIKFEVKGQRDTNDPNLIKVILIGLFEGLWDLKFVYFYRELIDCEKLTTQQKCLLNGKAFFLTNNTINEGNNH